MGPDISSRAVRIPSFQDEWGPRSASCLSFASVRRQEVIFVVEMTKSFAETNNVLIVMEKDLYTTQQDAITMITLRSRLLFFSA